MAGAVYADPGWLYGDTDVLYGLITAALADAQAASVRETALQVIVKDPQLNQWEPWAGVQQHPEDWLPTILYKPLNTAQLYEKEWYTFRASHSMTKLTDDTIVRVRLGDPEVGTDRRIFVQEVTDPTVPAQWESWSALYGGSHYGCAVQSDGAGAYNVYHSKSDGINKNNGQIYTNSIFSGPTYAPEAVMFDMVEGLPEAGWVYPIHRNLQDNRRTFRLYYSGDFVGDTPAVENFDYNHLTPLVAGMKLSDTEVGFVFCAPIYTHPRDNRQGSVIAVGIKNIATGVNSPLYPVRGIGGGAGISYAAINQVTQLSDGYYYMFGQEVHVLTRADEPNQSTSLGRGFPIWMRSKDFKHWSEPVVGPPVNNSWGPGAVAEKDDYLYWADGEVVWRRPTSVVEHDLSNYVPQLDFDIPRDNQAGTGNATVANPEKIHNNILELEDKEIQIRVGLRTAAGIYEYQEFDKHFMKRATEEVKGAASRLNLEFGNIWDRLDIQFKDVTNFVGRFTWDDFQPSARNQPFNYFFNNSVTPTVMAGNKRLRTGGIVVYTGWKGHNPDIEAQFSSVTGDPKLLVRYVNTRNYFYLMLTMVDGVITFNQVIDGVTTELDSWSGSVDSTPKLRIRLRWHQYDVWQNDNYIGGGFMEESPGAQGYAGFAGTLYDVGYVHIEDYEQDLTTADLIKTALAMGDFHEALVSDAGTKVYGLIWGPQTDVPTIAEGLRKALQIEKLELIWRNGSVVVGKFNDTTPITTIEDTIIESDQVNEANRRLNFAQVDGNDKYWIEVDTADTIRRDRAMVSYFDLPELTDLDAIKERAREEIRRSARGSSPGGTTPLYFDLNRMDTITWIDNQGVEHLVRIEGFSVDINQSTRPHQQQAFDLAKYIVGSDGGLVIPDDTE